MTSETAPAENEAPPVSLIFELEHIGINGRAIAYDVTKQVLSAKGIDLTPVLYSRYCVGRTPSQFLTPLFRALDEKLKSENKLIDEIEQSVRMAVLDGAVKLSPGVAKLIEAARSEGVRIAALTGLDQSTASQLMEKLGFDESSGVQLLCVDSTERGFPTADCWLKAAKHLQARPALCITYGSSSTAAKAALSAGMRCVSVPDSFTTFQDFSGSDFILDEVENGSFTELLGILRN